MKEKQFYKRFNEDFHVKVLEIQGSNTGHEQYHYGASLIEEHFGVEE